MTRPTGVPETIMATSVLKRHRRSLLVGTSVPSAESTMYGAASIATGSLEFLGRRAYGRLHTVSLHYAASVRQFRAMCHRRRAPHSCQPVTFLRHLGEDADSARRLRRRRCHREPVPIFGADVAEWQQSGLQAMSALQGDQWVEARVCLKFIKRPAVICAAD